MFNFDSLDVAVRRILAAGIFALGGLVLGFIAGGIFEALGIVESLPWQEAFTLFGGGSAGLLGLGLKDGK